MELESTKTNSTEEQVNSKGKSIVNDENYESTEKGSVEEHANYKGKSIMNDQKYERSAYFKSHIYIYISI